MKVLFLTRKWPPAVGGMETYSRDLAAELKRLVDLEIHALPGKSDGSPPGSAALAFFFLRAAWLLARRPRQWDVIHFGDFVLFPLAWFHAVVYPTTKRFVTVHGLDIIFGNRSGCKPWIYRHFMSWAARRRGCIAGLIANSKNTARLAREAGLGNSVVVTLGVNLQSAMDLGRPQPINPEDQYVLFIGRLVPRKGASWFATEVLPSLPAKIQFKVVGKAWDQKEASAIDAAQRAQRLGYLSDATLAILRAGAIAVVMPNISSTEKQDVEGFGITALESAIGGAPLLAADIEGITDAVTDGITGFLLPAEEPTAWANKIDQLAQWDFAARQAFFEKARETVKRNFSWQRVAQKTVDAYDKPDPNDSFP